MFGAPTDGGSDGRLGIGCRSQSGAPAGGTNGAAGSSMLGPAPSCGSDGMKRNGGGEGVETRSGV